MDYLRIWADEEGESHFEDVILDRTVAPAEPGVAELWISGALPVDRLHVVTVKAETSAPDWHCGPRRQFVVFLDGWVRLTSTADGARQLPAGSIVLVEDLHGRGHMTEHEPGDRAVLVIPLDPEPNRAGQVDNTAFGTSRPSSGFDPA